MICVAGIIWQHQNFAWSWLYLLDSLLIYKLYYIPVFVFILDESKNGVYATFCSPNRFIYFTFHQNSFFFFFFYSFALREPLLQYHFTVLRKWIVNCLWNQNDSLCWLKWIMMNSCFMLYSLPNSSYWSVSYIWF